MVSCIPPPRAHWRLFSCCGAIFIAIAIATRAFLATHYGPVIAGDSVPYLQLSEMIRTHDYSSYNGWRTHGYPWFLNLFHAVPSTVVLAQNIVGGLGTFLVSFVFLKMTRKPLTSVLLGGFLALSLNLVLLDEYILTESISTSLFSLFSATLVFSFAHSRSSYWAWAFCGLSVAALTLTRPQYVSLIPSIALCLCLRIILSHSNWKSMLALLLFLACSLPPVLLLLSFNKSNLGKATLSTTLSFNLSQHTLPFIEAAERVDETHLIPEIVRLRDQNWEQAQALDDNRAFIPRPDPYPLPDVYTRLSLEAIRREPLLYLSSVCRAWVRFWRVSLLYDSSFLRSPLFSSMVPWFWRLQKCIWLVANMLFVVNLPLVALTIFKRRYLGWLEFLSLSILAVSILQALVEYGDNSRYAVPMEPAIALVALYSSTVANSCRFTLASLVKAARNTRKGNP